MQRFINYRFKFVIYGDYSRSTRRPLKYFIRESNEGKDFSFVVPREEAVRLLADAQER